LHQLNKRIGFHDKSFSKNGLTTKLVDETQQIILQCVIRMLLTNDLLKRDACHKLQNKKFIEAVSNFEASLCHVFS